MAENGHTQAPKNGLDAWVRPPQERGAVGK